MTTSRVLLSQADITEVEERFVLDALHSGWVAPLGPHVDAFEGEVAQRVGVAGAVALSSGTAALHLALDILGARAGTVVILPTMTFAATANAVAYTGATPMFVDSRLDDANLDPDLVREAIDLCGQQGLPVAAIMTVDLFGQCCDNSAVENIAARHGIPVVEDAAEALGARTSQGAAGSFGRAAALSFNGNKVMTTSGGGMLLSDDVDLLQRARYLSAQARQATPWYEHTELGYNYRLSNILAALGRGQLTRLDAMIQRRRQIRARYEAHAGELEGIRFLGSPASDDPETSGDNYWLTTVVIDRTAYDVGADEAVYALSAAGIEARHLWKPMHRQPLYAGALSVLTGAAEALFRTGIALPSGSALTDDEVDRVVTALVTLLRGRRR